MINAEQWKQIRHIFDGALEYAPNKRSRYLDKVCANDDDEVRREVESLLFSLDSAESFLETPAVVKVVNEILPKTSQFSNGQILGHYEIIESIGTGGMGEVYLARDTKLNRRVALKVLRENLLSDKQANQRLLREAQAAALLDHPHICQIHEVSETDGYSFIVMQYVEGKTLSDILAKERLSVKTSLDLAIQITDALAEAHAHRLIHRDIKPANIMVNEKGQAKVLDFGLAKFVEAETNGETAQRLNSSGAVMGTVPFMSPEQLRGRRLDARTDIFSFGAMFYEMLTGRQAFARENNAETISAILNDQPDLTEIPERLQPILRKSLTKNKTERYSTAQDLAEDLRELQKSGELISDADSEFDRQPKAETVSTSSLKYDVSTESAHSIKRRFYFWKSSAENVRAAPETAWRNRSTVLSAVTIFAVIGVVALLVWQFKKTDDSGNFDALRSVRLVSWKSSASSDYGDYRVSNNGKMIALSSTQDGKTEAIYVKQVPDGGEDIRVTKDEWTNHSPIWSPDDQRIAFVSVRESTSGIYVSPSLGGAAILLKIIGKGDLTLRKWTKDGAAIFYEHIGNLFRLDLATQEIVKITDFAQSPANGRHFDLSPDEKQIVFVDDRNGQIDIWTMPLAGGNPVRLTNDAEKETRPLWHTDGKRILYNVVRDNDMQIYLAFTDATAPQQVTRGDGDYELADVSSDGAKVFYWFWKNNSDISGVKIETGEEFELASEIESELWADVSPDGKSIVYQTNESPHLTPNLSKSSLVVKSLENQSPPIILKGHNPRWLPDSRRVVFLRWEKEDKKYQYWLVNTASGEEKQLTTGGVSSPSNSRLPINRDETGNNWSPEANRFVYLDSKKQNVRMAWVESSETFNLTDNVNPNIRFYPPIWSPDGKRVVFLSTEKAEKPKWSIWLHEQGKTTEIYSGTAELRLLGWSASGNEILLAMTDGLMKSTPLDVKLLEVSKTGNSRVLTVFKNIYASSLTLSADGKMLAFVARNDDKDNVWMVAANGGETKKLTANSHNRLFYGSPAWSADGKTVFFDKQDQINTISMFENFK